ncbi:MAG TPA: hypothetical protein DCZ59_05415, partial [Bacteroidetes bacterium]|nr:hypothetical protein [Bacteroidota bacterium]
MRYMTKLALLLAVLIVPSVQAQVIPTARIGLTAGINGAFLGPSVQTWRSFASDTLPNLSPYVAPGIRFEDAGFGLGVMFGLQGAFPLSSTVH